MKNVIPSTYFSIKCAFTPIAIKYFIGMKSRKRFESIAGNCWKEAFLIKFEIGKQRRFKHFFSFCFFV